MPARSRSAGELFNDLPPTVLDRLEGVLERFEDAWRAGGRPVLDDYLTGAGAERRALLVELVHADLHYRLKAGEAARAEDYPGRYPELGDDKEAALGLIAAEYQLRRREPGCTPEEYLRRFPEYAEELPARLCAGSPGDPPTDGGVGTAPQDAPTRPDPEAAPPAAPAAGSRYRPLRYHARGGLGEVWVAQDAELAREVALKAIRPEHRGDRGSSRRFLVEAEVTARLQHPGVVPVYGLVQGADGQPCYAMRFIDGESLAEAIRRFHLADQAPGRDPGERSLALRDLLGRFVAVCDTIAYAHSRGIIHRDIKPANVMLGRYGETLVVDWGLAKAVGRDEQARRGDEETLTPSTAPGDEDHTPAGQPLGTPAYMSPEQAAGWWDEIGPASDVYGLGATLYAILTGEAPFSGEDALAVVRRVRRGEFVPPCRAKAGVPRALEAVCLKAMALEPAGRYATAGDLAADVRRWLADEPVTAWREPVTAHARRWVNRHRALVTGATAAVLVAAVGLAVAATVLRATNERLATTTHDLKSANAELTATNEKLTEAQKRATDNAEETRKVIERNYLRVSRDLNHPQFRPLRNALLEGMRTDLKNLLPKYRGDPLLRQELARTCSMLGRMTTVVGSYDEALPCMREYQDLSADMAQENPEDLSLQAQWADALDQVAHTLRTLKKPDEARPLYLQSIAIWERLAAADPGRYAHQLAYQYDDMSTFLLDLGQDHAEAWAYLRKGLEVMEPLVEKNPDNEEYVRGLAYFYNNRGEFYAQEGKLGAALEEHKRVIRIREKLVHDYPKDTKYGHRRWLARSLTRAGEVEQKLGKPDQAAEHFRAARDHLAGLVGRYPENLYYREDLAKCCQQYGNLLLDRKQWPDAFAALKAAGDSWEKVADAGPRGMDARLDCARARAGAGRALAESGRRPEAEAEWQRAIGQLREAVKGGFKGVGALKQDGALKPLHERDDFKSLCAELEQKGKGAG